MNLDDLTQADASLVQHGLKSLGYYSGTTKGLPGAKTKAAYAAYLASLAGDVPGNFGALMALVAKREVGAREVGNNGGAAVIKYQKATWLDTGPWPWCAAFVCWVVREVLAVHPRGFKRPRTPGAWDFLNWAKDEGLLIIETPDAVLEGDIIVYTFSHIGIATANSSAAGTVFAVEGNTNQAGSREGDGVYEKTRKTSQIRAIIRIV